MNWVIDEIKDMDTVELREWMYGQSDDSVAATIACIRDKNAELITVLTEMTVLGLKVMGLTPGVDQPTLEDLREAFSNFSELKAKFVAAAAMLELDKDVVKEGRETV